MKTLKEILYKVPLTSASGDMNVPVSSIVFDSRKAVKNSTFVAVKGTQSDGHLYIDQALNKGATSIVCEAFPHTLVENVSYVIVEDSAKSLAIAAANFYDNPSEKLSLIGVTGTNGKTTVVSLLHNLFQELGYFAGLLSTVNNKIGEEIFESTHTTPDAIQINELLAAMLKKGCTHCFMEVSSHALVQSRVSGLNFSGAVFTNMSHDHLDYHGTFESYISAKKLLFDNLPSSAFALVNMDDKRGRIMLQNTKAEKSTYSLKSSSDFKAKIISNQLEALEMRIDNLDAWFKLVGTFNAYNLLAVYATAVLAGEENETVLAALSNLSAAPGRFEIISSGSGITAIVDYAHTPDALENVLKTINHVRSRNEQLITVIGCGGNRDTEKRPLMASIACEQSDKVILTSDNPRDEDPAAIIKEMQGGVSPTNFKKTLIQPDREEAIKMACVMANEKDIILVAGKGHEDYQEIKGVKYPFDDKEVLNRMFKSISN